METYTMHALDGRRLTRLSGRAGCSVHAPGEVAAGCVEGLVVGDAAGRVVAAPERVHSALVGATGCGKTNLAIEQILLMASRADRPNLVVIDAKDTLWGAVGTACSGAGYRVRHLDLRDPSSSTDRYNPAAAASRAFSEGDRARAESLIGEVTDSLSALVESEKDRFWETEASALIKGVFFALCEIEREVSLPEVRKTIGIGQKGLRSLFGDDRGTLLEAILKTDMAKDTWGSVAAVAGAMLSFFDTHQARLLSSSSTFDPVSDLFDAERPLALFVTSPDESSSADAFAKLLLDQTYHGYVTRCETSGRPARDTHLFFDEFARYPRCCISAMLSTARSRGFFAHLIFQSPSQLLERNRYTEAEARVIMEQMGLVVYMANHSRLAADDVSVRSGGLVTGTDLSSLSRGECVVARMGGFPLLRTTTVPLEEFRGRYRVAGAAPCPSLGPLPEPPRRATIGRPAACA